MLQNAEVVSAQNPGSGLGVINTKFILPKPTTYLDNVNAFFKLTRILQTLILSTLKWPESGKIDTVKKTRHIKI